MKAKLRNPWSIELGASYLIYLCRKLLVWNDPQLHYMLAKTLYCLISVRELLKNYCIDNIMVMYMLKTAFKGSSSHYHSYTQRIVTLNQQENNPKNLQENQ